MTIILRSLDGAANVVVSCRGRLASAGDDGTIKLWGSTSWACEVTVHNLHIPVTVALLSRFLTNAQATEVLAGLADGSIDVVVGTHRLLGQDAKDALGAVTRRRRADTRHVILSPRRREAFERH